MKILIKFSWCDTFLAFVRVTYVTDERHSKVYPCNMYNIYVFVQTHALTYVYVCIYVPIMQQFSAGNSFFGYWISIKM